MARLWPVGHDVGAFHTGETATVWQVRVGAELVDLDASASDVGAPVDAAGMVNEVLADLRTLLVAGCAYLDPAHRG